MAAYDLVIRNGCIVDGSGGPRFRGDVATRGDRIAVVGAVEGAGRAELDATGLAVSPGFIDIHTHFDPQLCWDGHASPSIEHGVTTVVIGNCSLSLAPVRAGRHDKIVKMFGVIEEIRQATFDAAVPFCWESFPEYLDYLRPRLGINVGAMIGHSVLRYFVMGNASQEREANDAELADMCALVDIAMAAGALGISSSYVDRDDKGKPVPSQFASLKEKIALASAMGRSGRGVWQAVPNILDMKDQLRNIAELGEISRQANVVCSVQPVVSSPRSPLAEEIMATLTQQNNRGARVYGQVMPRCFDLNMRLSETSNLLYPMPTWRALMLTCSASERRQRYQDAEVRKVLIDEVETRIRQKGNIGFLRVGAVKSQANAHYVGRAVADIAAEERKAFGDVLLDIALADDLETEFQLRNVINADKQSVADLMDNPCCHIGASDAGAHVTQFCGTGDTTYLLEHFVRETGRMTLERAVYRVTGELADAWGFHDRGRIEPGRAADLVIFDPGTVRITGEEFVNDFPGESRRYVRRAAGYQAVVVNGQMAYTKGAYTGSRSGRVV